MEPPVKEGLPARASPLSRTINELTVMIGGQRARVFFSGLAPGFSGLYQVNVLVPDGIGSWTLGPGDWKQSRLMHLDAKKCHRS